ncbi:MAG TPA: EamA family transporter, partial [Deltaproteobacteria bacterium]|nr:EamA family transporter [Deltaproteobacteria bacterium]
MNDWYLFSLAALILFGLQRFLYKVSAEEGCNSALTSLAFMGTVTCLSTLFFLFSRASIGNTAFLLVISTVNGLSFLAGTLASMEALKRIPATTVLPLIRLNTVLVVLFGIFYFGEKPSMSQYIGIVISLAVIIVLARSSASGPAAGLSKTGRGIAYAAVALVAGAVAAVSSAFAAHA